MSPTGGSNSLAAAVGIGYVWDYMGHLYKQDYSDELIKSRKFENRKETAVLFREIYLQIELIREKSKTCYWSNTCDELRFEFTALDELLKKVQNSDSDRLGIIAQLRTAVITVAALFAVSIIFRECAGVRDFVRTRITLYLQMV